MAEAREEISSLVGEEEEFDYEDIAGKKPFEIAADAIEDVETPTETTAETPPVGTPVTPPVETPEEVVTPEPPVSPPTPAQPEITQVDVEAALTKQREEFTKLQEENQQRLVEVLTGRKQAEPTLVEPAWIKEGREPRDYLEIGQWSKDEALATLKAEQERQTQEAEDAQATTTKEEETYKTQIGEQWDTYWNAQIDDLITKERIPAIGAGVQAKMAAKQQLTEADREDPGVKARLDLYSLALGNQETDLRYVYHEYYKDREVTPPQQPAGSDAPISAGKGTVSDVLGEDSDFYYEDIHGKGNPAELLGL